MSDTEPKTDLIHADPSKPELVTKPDAAKDLAIIMDQINTLQKAFQKREAELGVGITDEEKLKQEDNMTAAIIIAEKYPHAVVGGKIQIVGDSGPFVVIKPDDGGRIRIIGKSGVSRFDRNSIDFRDASKGDALMVQNNENVIFGINKIYESLLEPFSKVASGIKRDTSDVYDYTEVEKDVLRIGSAQKVKVGIPVRGRNFEHNDSVRDETLKEGMLQKPFFEHMEVKYKSDPLPTDAKAPVTPISELF
jgi:hypothetical protein